MSPAESPVMKTASDPIINVRNITVEFGETGSQKYVQAIDDLSLEIKQREFVCIIGPSGCGKSTLLHIIGGLLIPTSGKIIVDHEEVAGPKPQKMAFVFQDYALFPWASVLDNIKLGLEFQGVDKKFREERAYKYLSLVGLHEFAQYLPKQLSGGMKQRVAIARALSLETEILLMDEPFGALDEQTRMVLGEELSRILANSEKTIVFITHSLSEAVFLADKVVVMTARPGKVKEIINVQKPHPRNSHFMGSDEFSKLRNQLYYLLREEIKKVAL